MGIFGVVGVVRVVDVFAIDVVNVADVIVDVVEGAVVVVLVVAVGRKDWFYVLCIECEVFEMLKKSPFTTCENRLLFEILKTSEREGADLV